MAQIYTIEEQGNLKTNNEQNPSFHYTRLSDDQKSTSFSQSDLPSTSPFDENFYSSSTQPELYYVKAEQTNIPYSNSPSPSVPYEPINQPRPEVYYISIQDEKSYEPTNTHLTVNTKPPSDNKITAYMITSLKDDQSRVGSLPPIRTNKKKHNVSFNIGHGQNNSDRNDFLMESHDTSNNIRYAPLLQSKASESIKRSMDKYRFGENEGFY